MYMSNEASPSKNIRAIAITAGKGGVGKTNISVNISAALAKLGNKVMLLDADLGLGNVDILLGLHPRNNLSHVIGGNCSLDQILVKGPHDINIVPAGSGIQNLSDLSQKQYSGLISAFDEISNDVDVLVVDTAAGISNSVVNFAQATQEVIIVVCDEPTSMADAYATIKILSKNHRVRSFKIIASMVKNEEQGKVLFQKIARVADRYLDVNLSFLGTISFDENLKKSVKQQKAVIDAYPGSRVSKQFSKLAEKIIQDPTQEKSLGHLSFFLEKLVVTE